MISSMNKRNLPKVELHLLLCIDCPVNPRSTVVTYPYNIW